MKLFNCNIVREDREILIEEIDVALRYKVAFNFKKLDVATGECEYTYDVKFDYVVIEAMSSHEEFEDHATSEIEKIVVSDRRFELKDLTFKPVLKKLQ